MADKSSPGADSGVRRSSVAYQRPKKTKASVIVADRAADRTIRIGGSLVILAVFTIMVFLVWMCLPLLTAGKVEERIAYRLPSVAPSYLEAQMDEHRTVALDLAPDGKVAVFHVATGAPLAGPSFDFGGKTLTAFAQTLRGDDVLFGFSDGTVRVGRLVIKQNAIPADTVPAGLTVLSGSDKTDGRVVYSDAPDNQARRTEVVTELGPEVQVAPVGTPIIKADYRIGSSLERPLKTFVTLDQQGTLRLSQAYSRFNMMTGEEITDVSSATIPFQVATTNVTKLLLNTTGERVIIGEKDGTLLRFDTRNFQSPRLAETRRTLPDGVTLTSLAYLNGESSLVVGGSDGSVAIWFGIDRKSSETADGIELTKVHADFKPHGAPVTDIKVSQRTRMFTTSDAAGETFVRHATTERTLLELPDGPDRNGLLATIFAPRDNGVLAIGKNGEVVLWKLAIPHPETTLQSLFGKVWYEGRAEPEFVWQSTAGQDSYEPKLSLVPLIFGTFKAAVYSLMFAIPIALLAAIYTSEFLQPRTRAVVKPVMELMATLPSVVVGFVAALVLSPIVENFIAAVVIAFAVVPLTLIGMSLLWQTLPKRLSLLLDGLPKLLSYLGALALAIWGAAQLGPLIESTFFGGNFKVWTAGGGSAEPFLFLLAIPISFFIVFLVTRPLFGGGYTARLRSLGSSGAGFVELLRWLVLAAAAFALAWAIAALLTGLGYDPRGGLVDTYVQRNALVAGFAIAFAEIPIIYTISEDAINTVPSYLRAGSLACGATRWQTTSRIILPTAASGIFSAIMIGLGRAVGETMIVVMATGNTPVMDVNIFNGLRTLSANINVELPEAVRDSTLYRTLFLCGLTLFVMTFVINTIAEVVRQRYRKRAAQL